MTDKLSKVRNSNVIVQANFTDFSLSVYRVFLKITSKMQKHYANGDLIPLDLACRTCSLSAAEYAKEYGLEENHSYEILKMAVDKLLKTSFTLPVDAGLLKINICSQALYVKKAGRIDIEFTPNIMPHLAGLTEQFTMYNLNEIAGFNSIYTTRFYELLMQWKITGRLEITVAALRHALGCVNNFKRFSNFKKDTFGHAMEEINSKYKINIRCQEIRKGKSVDSLIITFKPTERHLAYDVVKQKYRTQLTRPKKIKPTKQETPLTHDITPSKQNAPLPQNIANGELAMPGLQAQNLIVESPPLPKTETQNQPSQKKKRFFGLF